jgi:hypothetical protein
MSAEGGCEKASVARPATERPKLAVDSGDPQVVAGLEDYLRAVESGAPVTREALLAKYPEVADVLGKCLDGLDLVRLITPGGGRLGR